MSALTNLQASIQDLATTVTDGIAEIETLLTKITTPGASELDIQASADQIATIAAAIKAEVQKARTAQP